MLEARFGKHPPKIDYRTLLFKNYVTATLPDPPEAYSVLPQVYKNLKMSDPAKLFPMDGNSKYGDCTIAAMAHAITINQGLIKKKNIWTEEQAIRLYFKLTGGKDSGLNELDVLNYWHSHLVDGDQILAYTKIDHRHHNHVKQAIKMFGGVYLGFQVQWDALQQFRAKKPWNPGRLSTDGHAVYAVGYDATGIDVLTWGNIQHGSWAWWDECVDEAYAILPPEAEKRGFARGFNFKQLKEDLNAVSG